MHMPSDSPQVSVLMGVRYQQDDLYLLKRSIESILSQSFSNFEFLICEQDSTLNAKRYLQELERKESRVRLIDGRGADTLAAKLNRCIDAARGVYFARQDDDDTSDPMRFQLQMDYLAQHREAAFTGSVAQLEQDGTVIGIRKLPEEPQIRDFLFVQPFLHPTLLFRADVFDSGIRYNESQRCAGCEDYDLLLRLYERGAVGRNLQTPCFTYTLPPGGVSNRSWTMRRNEVYTRWERFKSLGLLPGAMPYVIKPLVVGMIPKGILGKLKEIRQCRT